MAELDAAEPGAHLNAVVLQRIEACESSHDLAQLWEQVTVGGSVPERWAGEVQAASIARLEQIKAATPLPPSNPFA